MCSKDALDDGPVETGTTPAVGEAVKDSRMKAIEAEQNRIAAEEQAKREEVGKGNCTKRGGGKS